MKLPQKNTIAKLSLRILSLTALLSAYTGANMACCFLYHDPKKPEALKNLKKF